MEDFQNHCFVCNAPVDAPTAHKNKALNLPVCDSCKETDQEIKAVEELKDGLGEGFVSGCI